MNMSTKYIQGFVVYTESGQETLRFYAENALKVNGHTVDIDVPSNAKFTDTVYTHPEYTAKTSGLYKVTVDGTGHVSSATLVKKADITALGIPAQDTVYEHPTSGVTAGTYKSVTVDANGHVTAGSNPTTLEGYGITDAAAKNHSHRRYSFSGSDGANSAGWYKIASGTIAANEDLCVTLAVTSTFSKHASGILNIHLRANSSGIATNGAVLHWLSRQGFNVDDIIAVINGNDFTIYYNQTIAQWGRIIIEVLSEACRTNGTSGFSLISSTAPESTAPTASITSSDNIHTLGAVNALGYTTDTAKNLLVSVDTLAWWNGAYGGTASNLSYCKKGAFGDAVTRGVDAAAKSGSTNLITSGAMYTALSGKASESNVQDLIDQMTYALQSL